MSFNLLALQDRMKRDPSGYREEFLQQVRHFMSNMHLFKLQPLTKSGRSLASGAGIEGTSAVPVTGTAVNQHGVQSRRVQEFASLVSFLAHASSVYRTEVITLRIPQELFTLLFEYAEALDPFLRKMVVQSLIMMQNKGLIPRSELLPALFRIFRCSDKELRKSIFLHIVADLYKVYTTNQKGMFALQKTVYAMLKDENDTVALKALQILIELWKKGVWAEQRTVNAIASACFHSADKIVRAALLYFLAEYDLAAEEGSEKAVKMTEKQKLILKLSSSLKHIKRREKKQRAIDRAKKAIKKAEEDEDEEDEEAEIMKKLSIKNPISLIYDAQHFAERLFSRLKTSKESFQTRLLIMNLISKLIGYHKLLLFNYYPFVQRFLNPTQRNITQILVFLSRATHNLVPPEVLSPIVRTLAYQFVTDRSKPEVIAIGIGTIREICSRAPLVMSEDLLTDLSAYAKHKNKGIMIAARSLIQVFRELNPAMLHRKLRGKDATMGMLLQQGPGSEAARERAFAASRLEYGSNYVHRDVEGALLLDEVGIFGADDKDATVTAKKKVYTLSEMRKRADQDDEWEAISNPGKSSSDITKEDELMMHIEEAFEDDTKEPKFNTAIRKQLRNKRGRSLIELKMRLGLLPSDALDKYLIARGQKKGRKSGARSATEEVADEENDGLDWDSAERIEMDEEDFEDMEGMDDEEAMKWIKEGEQEYDTLDDLDDDMLDLGNEDEDEDVDNEDEDEDEDLFGDDEDIRFMSMDEFMGSDDDEDIEDEDLEGLEEPDEEDDYDESPKPMVISAGSKKGPQVKPTGKGLQISTSKATIPKRPTKTKVKIGAPIDSKQEEKSNASQNPEASSSASTSSSRPIPRAALRILTPADFERINELQKQKLLEGIKGMRKRQRILKEDVIQQRSMLDTMNAGGYKEVTEDDIEVHTRKRVKTTREERMARVQESREEIMAQRNFVKFGHRSKQTNLGDTQEHKARNKNFMMIKHSRKTKAKAHIGIREANRKKSAHIAKMRSQRMEKGKKKGRN